MRCMCPPEQGQVVVPMVCGDGLDVGAQRIDTAPIFENPPDPASQDVIAGIVLYLVQDLAEDTDQCLLHFPVSLLQEAQLLLRRMPGLSHSPQEHLDQLVARPRLGLEQQAEDQGMAFTRLGEITKIADLKPGGLRRELPDLRVSNAGEQRLRIEDGVQLREALRPPADVLQRCRSWRFLQVRDSGDALPRCYFKQGIQVCGLPGIELGGDRAVQGSVDLLTQMADEAIEGAECGQLDVRPRQRLDGQIDQVCGIAHGQCRGADDRFNQPFASITVSARRL